MVRLRSTRPTKPDIDPFYLKHSLYTKCFLSRERLRQPVVSSPEGRMINKEALIEALLRSNKSEVVKGVKSLRDVVELKLNEGKTDRGTDALFSCPITLKPLNGHFKFLYNSSCGCVIAESATKEMAFNGANQMKGKKTCLVCDKEIERVMTINAEGEEAKEQLTWWMEHRKTKRRVE
jgi:hypothetical protein